MKKKVLIVLLAMLCMVSFTACFGEDESQGRDNVIPDISPDSGESNDGEIPTSSNSEDNDSNINDDNANDNINKLGDIYAALPFSEGYAFISQNRDDDRKLNTCIDKQGNVVFTLPGKDDCAYSIFKNGVAMVTIDGVACLVNTKGEIVVSPETHGYTNGFYDVPDYTTNDYNGNTEDRYGSYSAMFTDGFFAVYKENITFEGTTYQYGVIGFDGEWILELSDTYFNSVGVSPSQRLIYDVSFYDKGYLCFEYDNSWHPSTLYWNLNSGAAQEHVNLYDEWSQYSYTNEGELAEHVGVFKDHNGEVMLDVSEKYPTMKISRQGFKEGYDVAIVYFKPGYTDDASIFFSLMDRSGTLLFEPKEIHKKYQGDSGDLGAGINEEGGYAWWISPDYIVEIYDLTGKLISKISLPEKTNEGDESKIGNKYVYERYVTVRRNYDDNSFLICDYYEILERYGPSDYLSFYYFVDDNGNFIYG